MPPAAGKRHTDRGKSGRTPAHIIFTPRPHLTVHMAHQSFMALIDTGSEASFVNCATATKLHEAGIHIRQANGQIRMADGTGGQITGLVKCTIRIMGQKHQHELQILPALESEILIGIDLWAKTRRAIPPPPLITRPEIAAAYEMQPIPDENTEGTRLKAFLEKELEKFEAIRGPTDKVQHNIRVKTDTPIKQRYRPRNPAMQRIIDEEVEKMENEGIIEPSHSAWSSPVVIVKKKDGKPRFCIDFRRVNDVTERDAYPLPQITATLDKLRGAQYLTTLDLKNGYWQVPLTPDSREVTAFTVPGKGLMQFRVMPFGLHSAPATFQRLLDNVLGPELEPNVFVYLDDIIICNQSFDEHLETLLKVFNRLRDARLRLNPEKCKFCVNRIKYLGHIIDREGIRTDPEKVNAITDWPTPKTVKQIRQFLGVASWYRRFIKDFAATATPLTALTRKNAKWSWDKEQQRAFEQLKTSLTTAPVLACPDFTRQFCLQTDASTAGIGAVLTQYFPEGERVIAYASRTLNNAERNYSATELECLAVLWGIRKMRGYVEGYHFQVITDHQSLRWLQKLESPTGRLGRWAFELQTYDFEIKYRKGVLNKVADALSRQPAVAIIRKKRCQWYQRLWQTAIDAPHETPDLRIEKGKLYKHILHNLDFKEIAANDQWKECVPKEERGKILERYHDAPTAGHLGTAKTISRIAQNYYWPGMFREITRYVQSCQNCLAHKAVQNRPFGTLHPTIIERPWQQVTIDLVGPLPRSNKGHTWLLNMQDRFTKWTEIRPLRRATATDVLQHITKAIVLRHGCPEEVLSDNGTQLKSAKLSSEIQKMGIRHRFTPAYAPQCNPVERTNRTIKTMIAQYVKKRHRTWDEHLDEIQFAYNTATHEATGYTPAYLNHGRELRRPHEPEGRGSGTTPHSLQKRLEDAYELVRIQLARAFQRQERHYNLRRRDWRPQIGDWVWKRDHPLSNKAAAFNAKLAPKYIGPVEVRRIVSPVIVDLRNKQGKWFRHVHVKDIKLTPTAEINNDADVNND